MQRDHQSNKAADIGWLTWIGNALMPFRRGAASAAAAVGGDSGGGDSKVGAGVGGGAKEAGIGLSVLVFIAVHCCSKRLGQVGGATRSSNDNDGSSSSSSSSNSTHSSNRKSPDPSSSPSRGRRKIDVLKFVWSLIDYREMMTLVSLVTALMLRSYCDLKVIHLVTSVEKSIIHRRRGDSVKTFACMMLPLSLINAGLNYSVYELSLMIHTKLNHKLQSKLFQKKAFYQLTRPTSQQEPDGMSNPDQIITNDIQAFAHAVSKFFSHTLKPVIDVSMYTYYIAKEKGLAYAPAIMGSYMLISGLFLDDLRSAVSKFVVREQELEGTHRGLLTRIFTFAEEIASLGGGSVEYASVRRHFETYVSFLRQFAQFRFCVSVIDRNVTKYILTVMGWYIIDMSFNDGGSLYKEADGERIYQSYHILSRMMSNWSAAIGELLYSWKDVLKIVGMGNRIMDFEAILDSINALEEEKEEEKKQQKQRGGDDYNGDDDDDDKQKSLKVTNNKNNNSDDSNINENYDDDVDDMFNGSFGLSSNELLQTDNDNIVLKNDYNTNANTNNSISGSNSNSNVLVNSNVPSNAKAIPTATSCPTYLLKVRNLDVMSPSGKVLIKSLNFNLDDNNRQVGGGGGGGNLLISGPNGSGKSSIFRYITGLWRPSSSSSSSSSCLSPYCSKSTGNVPTSWGNDDAYSSLLSCSCASIEWGVGKDASGGYEGARDVGYNRRNSGIIDNCNGCLACDTSGSHTSTSLSSLSSSSSLLLLSTIHGDNSGLGTFRATVPRACFIYLPQKPYFPIGPLYFQVTYPYLGDINNGNGCTSPLEVPVEGPVLMLLRCYLKRFRADGSSTSTSISTSSSSSSASAASGDSDGSGNETLCGGNYSDNYDEQKVKLDYRIHSLLTRFMPTTSCGSSSNNSNSNSSNSNSIVNMHLNPDSLKDMNIPRERGGDGRGYGMDTEIEIYRNRYRGKSGDNIIGNSIGNSIVRNGVWEDSADDSSSSAWSESPSPSPSIMQPQSALSGSIGLSLNLTASVIQGPLGCLPEPHASFDPPPPPPPPSDSTFNPDAKSNNSNVSSSSAAAITSLADIALFEQLSKEPEEEINPDVANIANIANIAMDIIKEPAILPFHHPRIPLHDYIYVILKLVSMDHLILDPSNLATSLECSAETSWQTRLSGGEQQRLSFARLLFHLPRCALLDESTSAVSESAALALYELCSDLGMRFVTITHSTYLRRLHNVELSISGDGSYNISNI